VQSGQTDPQRSTSVHSAYYVTKLEASAKCRPAMTAVVWSVSLISVNRNAPQSLN
jgi:hypothetical protein